MNFQLESIESDVEEVHDGPENLFLSQKYDYLTENQCTTKIDFAGRSSTTLANLTGLGNNPTLHHLIQSSPQIRRRQYRVLVVDDSTYNLFVMKEILSTMFEDAIVIQTAMNG
jgi:hypothetical protein